MTPADLSAIAELVDNVIQSIDLNTEKLQEVLDQRGIKEQSEADFQENVLGWLQRIHQQGTP